MDAVEGNTNFFILTFEAKESNLIVKPRLLSVVGTGFSIEFLIFVSHAK